MRLGQALCLSAIKSIFVKGTNAPMPIKKNLQVYWQGVCFLSHKDLHKFKRFRKLPNMLSLAVEAIEFDCHSG